MTQWSVTVVRGADALPEPALRLLEQREQANFEFGHIWYRNLIGTVFGQDPTVRFYLLWREQEVAAILPLHAERTLLGWKVRALSNFYTTLYEPALAHGVAPEQLALLLQQVKRDFRGLASLTLNPLDQSAPAYPALRRAMSLAGLAPFEYFSFGNWYLPVTMDWPAYLAGREGMLRSTIKRAGKKFAAAGGTLQLVKAGDDITAALGAYQAVYAASWKRPEPYPDFIPGLLGICARKGVLRMGVARLNGKPIAAQIWMVNPEKAAIYKLAYDEAYKAHASGTLLTAMLVEHVISQDKVKEIDYLNGDDPYKQAWMSQRRERWGLVAYNPWSVSGSAALLREILGRTAVALMRRLGGKRGRESAPQVPAGQLTDA